MSEIFSPLADSILNAITGTKKAIAPTCNPDEPLSDYNPCGFDDAPPEPVAPPESPKVPSLPIPSLPPINIYEDDPDITIYYYPPPVAVPAPPLPPLPERRLPKRDAPIPPGTPTSTYDKVQTVETAANSRQYGCLLHEPIAEDGLTLTLCNSSNFADQFSQQQQNALNHFLNWLKGEIIGEICDVGISILKLPTNIPGIIARTGLIYGCEALGNLADEYARRANSGLLQVRGTIPIAIQYIDCTPPVAESPSENQYLDDLVIPLNEAGDECFIPVRNFQSGEPYDQGYKTQLQIVFADKNGDTAKRLTIPDPKEDLTAEIVKNVIGGGLEFGQVKCEADVSTYGYLRHYSVSHEAGEDLFNRVIELSNGKIVPNSYRASLRNRTIKNGFYKAYRAFVFEFKDNQGVTTCKRMDLR